MPRMGGDRRFQLKGQYPTEKGKAEFTKVVRKARSPAGKKAC